MTAAVCLKCGTWSPDAKLVEICETASGPGGMVYACPPCRHAHRLVPLTEPDD